MDEKNIKKIFKLFSNFDSLKNHQYEITPKYADALWLNKKLKSVVKLHNQVVEFVFRNNRKLKQDKRYLALFDSSKPLTEFERQARIEHLETEYKIHNSTLIPYFFQWQKDYLPQTKIYESLTKYTIMSAKEKALSLTDPFVIISDSFVDELDFWVSENLNRYPKRQRILVDFNNRSIKISYVEAKLKIQDLNEFEELRKQEIKFVVLYKENNKFFVDIYTERGGK